MPAGWQLVQDDLGRWSWVGGSFSPTSAGVRAPRRRARLIYPDGFPARFIEARLNPELPESTWGMVGAHVNVDGSACYITGEGWTPQLTVRDALNRLTDWWFNYWALVINELGDVFPWPGRGRVVIPSDWRAALHR